MVKLVGVIRKPSDVGEWPFWKEVMDHLDGEHVVVEIGKVTEHYPGNTGLGEPQRILFLPNGVAINIMWIHEMEFVHD